MAIQGSLALDDLSPELPGAPFAVEESARCFAVVDLETTGFSRYDRIIEIAVIRCDLQGRELTRYCTLINPARRVGSTSVHGIHQEQVRHAPTFQSVAGDIAEVMDEAVIVAHNIGFDFRFLKQEFSQLEIDLSSVPTACTMSLSGGLKLDKACQAAGIPMGQHHQAMADTEAALELLRLHLAAGALRRTPAPFKWGGHLPRNGRSLQRPGPPRPAPGLELLSTHPAVAIRYHPPGSLEPSPAQIINPYQAEAGELSAYSHQSRSLRIFKLERIIQWAPVDPLQWRAPARAR